MFRVYVPKFWEWGNSEQTLICVLSLVIEWKHRNLIYWNMAEAAHVAPNAELFEWPKKDNRRLLHVVYRVGDLERTIKYVSKTLFLKFLMNLDVGYVWIFLMCCKLDLGSGFILKFLGWSFWGKETFLKRNTPMPFLGLALKRLILLWSWHTVSCLSL